MNKTKTRVVSADSMDADTFTRHFNARHKSDLGGANEITNTLAGELLDMHRAFHKRIHELAPWLDHEHSEADK